MVLIFEDKFETFNSTEYGRATARISMNDFEDFVKFEVITNEIPVAANMTSGKDIIVDWGLLNDFDTGGKLFVDTNGLQMNNKELLHRREFTYNTNNTIAANYYPITSAIMVRDQNSSSKTDDF